MQTLISQAIEETLEEAFGHDPEYHTQRSALQQRLEEALLSQKVTKPLRRDRKELESLGVAK